MNASKLTGYLSDKLKNYSPNPRLVNKFMFNSQNSEKFVL